MSRLFLPLGLCLLLSGCHKGVNQTQTQNTQTENTQNQQDNAPSTAQKSSIQNCQNKFYQDFLPLTDHKDLLLCHSRLSVALNPQTHLADYSAEHLSGQSGPGERDTEFIPDPDAPTDEQIESRTYSHSGYDRGHLSPAADFKDDPQAMHESFYTSNVAPQNQTLNREAWAGLESAVRSCARHTPGGIYVLTGVIIPKNPNYIGRYQKIPVPSDFWKIIVSPQGYRAFIYPNIALGKSTPSAVYGVNLDLFERTTNIKPLPDNNLPRTLCKEEFGK